MMEKEKIFQISLAAARVNAEMTQEQVAKEMQVTKRTILNWEKGRIIPSAATLNMLSEIYKIPLEYIFLQTKSTLSEKTSKKVAT